MSDPVAVHFGENSQEQVAFKLMQNIAAVEQKEFHRAGHNPADRKWILETYRECLRSVRNPFID